MTLKELIEKLNQLPQDTQDMIVQFRASEWYDCGDLVTEVHDIDYVSIIDNIVTLE